MHAPGSTPSRLHRLLAGAAFQKSLRWAAPLATAGLLASLSLFEALLFPLTELPKGSVAQYTIRATHDAVFDLHQTFKAEVEEARRSYLPIYIRDGDLPYSRQEAIIKSALAEPLGRWGFPPEVAHETAEMSTDGGVPDAALLTDGREEPAGDGGADAQGAAPLLDERQREIEALIRGAFRLIESTYRDGVVGDSEFPKEKSTIRVLFGSDYNTKPVAELQRFSSLRPTLERTTAQLFIRSESEVRAQVIDYILQRLPPNLTYAKENERFIADISQVTGVKMVLIRNGEILVRRGQTVDTRAYYAIRASVAAARETSRLGAALGKVGLLLAIMLLFVVASREISPTAFRSPRSYLALYGGLLLLAFGGNLLLFFLPVHASLIPQAALALTLAVVLGRGPGLLASVTVPACLILTQAFSLSTLLVATAGGVSAALTVRRRRRGTALAAGVIIGVVQAVVFEACRVLEGRPRTYEELWSAGQAFAGGILAGLVAGMLLPFVEWLLGKSSRGKLRVLTSFDHPLLRELREKAPGTFAHSITLINMVEPAAEAVSADRLLTRAGALYHDIGKIANPQHYRENAGRGVHQPAARSPEEEARAILEHVAEGLRIASRHRFPPDVAAFIPEHHGTTRLDNLWSKALRSGQEPDPAVFHYPGPKPRSLETAIVMLADAVYAAASQVSEASEEALGQLVDRVIFKKLSEVQFDECGINQADLRRIKRAFVEYLKSARGVLGAGERRG